MSVESLDSRQQLVIRPQVDQHLGVGLDGREEEGEGTRSESVRAGSSVQARRGDLSLVVYRGPAVIGPCGRDRR